MWEARSSATSRLVQDLRGDVLLVLDDDAAGIDHFEAPAVVFGSPMDTVARNAGFVARRWSAAVR